MSGTGVSGAMLKEYLKKRGISIDQIAKEIGMDRTTFYRKVKMNGAKFTIAEAREIVKALKLSEAEATDIFFTGTVA